MLGVANDIGENVGLIPSIATNQSLADQTSNREEEEVKKKHAQQQNVNGKTKKQWRGENVKFVMNRGQEKADIEKWRNKWGVGIQTTRRKAPDEIKWPKNPDTNGQKHTPKHC